MNFSEIPILIGSILDMESETAVELDKSIVEPFMFTEVESALSPFKTYRSASGDTSVSIVIWALISDVGCLLMIMMKRSFAFLEVQMLRQSSIVVEVSTQWSPHHRRTSGRHSIVVLRNSQRMGSQGVEGKDIPKLGIKANGVLVLTDDKKKALSIALPQSEIIQSLAYSLLGRDILQQFRLYLDKRSVFLS